MHRECRAFQEIVDAYVEDELQGDAAAKASRHVETCERCRRDAEMLAAAMASLRSVDPGPSPERVRTGVFARVAELDRRTSPRPLLIRWGAAAAALALVAVGFSMVRHAALRPAEKRPVQVRTAVPRAATESGPSFKAQTVPEPAAMELAQSPVNVASAPQTQAKTPPHPRSNRVRREAQPSGTRTAVSMPDSFLDVADSRGITARDLLEARSELARALRPLPQVQETGPRAEAQGGWRQQTLNERVRVGDSVTELLGEAEWDATGRLKGMRIQAATVEEPGTARVSVQER